MGPSHVECPYDAEVWSCNTGYFQIAHKHGHINKIFIAHKQVIKKGKAVFNWEHFNQLRELGVETVSLHKIDGLNYTRFPLGYISKKFGCDYFSDTICYMLAYALHEATKPIKEPPYVKLKYPFRISMYGIDMRETGEYGFEKGGVEYWIGFMRGLGVEFQNTVFSTLLKTVTFKPYGLSNFSHEKTFDGGRVIVGIPKDVLNGKRASGTQRRNSNSSQDT